MLTGTFSAALLAGGKSSRMGRDKALIELPETGQLLWQRQLAVLEELSPTEILWSGPSRPGLPRTIHLVHDKISDAGPLAGLSACLEASRSDFLVMLAIDLPQMTASFLSNLRALCSPKCGVVPRRGDFYEPLAAVYPREIAPLVSDHLRQNQLTLQQLVREAVAREMLREYPLGPKDEALFKNLNRPADLAGN